MIMISFSLLFMIRQYSRSGAVRGGGGGEISPGPDLNPKRRGHFGLHFLFFLFFYFFYFLLFSFIFFFIFFIFFLIFLLVKIDHIGHINIRLYSLRKQWCIFNVSTRLQYNYALQTFFSEGCHTTLHCLQMFISLQFTLHQ